MAKKIREIVVDIEGRGVVFEFPASMSLDEISVQMTGAVDLSG